MTTSIDPERRAALLGAQLRALAASHDAAGVEGAQVVPFAGGAGLRAPAATWALLHPVGDDRSARKAGPGLGAVLAWATQGHEGAPPPLHVVVGGDAGSGVRAMQAGDRGATIARQAALFDPAPTVWRVRDRALVPVAPVPAPAPPEPAPAALALLDQLRLAGLDVVVEQGVVRGEIAGLEVAVVSVDDEGTARIEVGVGRNDREAFALLHGNLPPAEAMERVADTVRSHRRPGALPHPLNRMAPERWLRSHLLRDPERLVGWDLEAVPGVTARSGVADAGPAFAYGRDDADRPVVVACSVGIDLELVPLAAEARVAVDPAARLVLAVPARDAHPVTARLAVLLRSPAELLPVDGEWRR